MKEIKTCTIKDRFNQRKRVHEIIGKIRKPGKMLIISLFSGKNL